MQKMLSLIANRNVSIFLVFSLLLLAVSCTGGDDGVSSEFASIAGKVTFQNVDMWPDSGDVQITLWPDGIWTANGPIGPPQNPNNPITLIRNGNAADYQFIMEGLPEGTYSAIAVGWRTPDESVPANERSAVLGVYLENPQVSTGLEITFPGSQFVGPLPDPITVSKGQELINVDILADFANIALFFPPALNKTN